MKEKFITPDHRWVIETEGCYLSQVNRPHPWKSQRLIYPDNSRDGRMRALIEVVQRGDRDNNGYPCWDACILFRYQDLKNFYIAGLGGFGGQYFIGMWKDGQAKSIATHGNSETIEKGESHLIEIACSGSKISLWDNGVPVLSVYDNSFNYGNWGLHGFNVEARFSDVEIEIVPPTCFVIMPFSDVFDEAYTVINETVTSLGLRCVRADKRYLSGVIMADVFDQIEQAAVIIADFTGKNPNVFYEAGYAAAIRKPVIQIAQEVADLPFDIKHLRTFKYIMRILGDGRLSADLKQAIKSNIPFDLGLR